MRSREKPILEPAVLTEKSARYFQRSESARHFQRSVKTAQFLSPSLMPELRNNRKTTGFSTGLAAATVHWSANISHTLTSLP